MERQNTHQTLQSDGYTRYILVKGKQLSSVEQKLQEFKELYASEGTPTHQMALATLGEWTVVKLPSTLSADHYNYHNMVYWLLGTPPDDDNYADEAIGLSMGKGDNTSYLLYNDYPLKDEMDLEDDIFGIFENNEKFILSIPFDEFKTTENKGIAGFQQFLINHQIDFNTLKTDNLAYSEFTY